MIDGRFPEPPRPQPTGRYIVYFDPTKQADIAGVIKNTIGAASVDTRETGLSARSVDDALAEGQAVVFPRFKVAAISPSPGTEGAANMAALGALNGVEARPEFYLFAITELQQRYREWARSGLMLLAEAGHIPAPYAAAAASEIELAAANFADTPEHTWGLAATGAHRSAFKGRGVRAAVLDTGIDLAHPDFVGRPLVSETFVPGETVQDGQGHGTHTAGTVAGPENSSLGRRYGVAPEAELFIGKVLNNSGSGREADILLGINWAIDRKCTVISMSLGRAVGVGEKPDPLYEEVGAAALAEGCLIIAAAGNDSARDFGFIAPVGAPANSPSIMAVTAVSPTMKIAPFASGGVNKGGGEVDVSGPGVSVYSAFPRPRLTRLLDGTSMACPHVAGIAAQWNEFDRSLTGMRLWEALRRSAKELGTVRDFGRGLVQAPDAGGIV